MRVLGIDPSSQATGFGIIDYDDKTCRVLAFGTIKPRRRLPFHQKLNEIQQRLEELMATHQPEEVAIENPFYARNIKTALTLGQVRGAVLVAVASRNCSLYEYLLPWKSRKPSQATASRTRGRSTRWSRCSSVSNRFPWSRMPLTP